MPCHDFHVKLVEKTKGRFVIGRIEKVAVTSMHSFPCGDGLNVFINQLILSGRMIHLVVVQLRARLIYQYKSTTTQQSRRCLMRLSVPAHVSLQSMDMLTTAAVSQPHLFKD